MFSVDDICRRQSHLEDERANFESLWEKVAERLSPHHNDFRKMRAQGEQRTNQRYDAFPVLALHRYGAAMEAGLTPRTTIWHGVYMDEPELDDDESVKTFYEEFNRTLWRSRYAPRANFANQNHEVLLSHGAFGNACLFIEPEKNGVGAVYRSVHLSQCYVVEDSNGRTDTIHRKFELSARAIREKFPDNIPERVAKALERGKLDEKFEVLHVVMPRADYDPKRLDYMGTRYTDIFVLLDGKEPMRMEGGFFEMPYAFARGVTSSRETYGRGIGVQLLPDIMMLNEMKRDIIEAANMQVDPPTLLHDSGILGEFRLQPGARNYGGVDDNGRPLAVPFQSGANIGIGLDLVQDTRAQIDDAMLGAYFRVLLENPQMTATQALLLAQQQGQMTSPTVGRLQSEYLDTVIRRESGILMRQGRHPPLPPALREYMDQTGERLKIKYESPLSRAAQAGEAVSIQQTFEALAPWAQVMGPEVYAKFDPGKVADLMVRVNGVPRDVLRSDEEMQEQQEAEAQQMAMQQILQAAPVAAQTVKTLGEAQAQAQNIPDAVA